MRYYENGPGARRRMALLAVTAGAVLLAAACGASPSSAGSPSSAASGGSSSSAASSSSASPGSSADAAAGQQVAYAECMRAHGVTDYPDSGNVLGASQGSDLNPGNPTYQAAQQACQSLRPTVHLSPAQVAQDQADALKFSECMRQHGITKYPDPQPGSDGNDRINLSGIDSNSPQFQAAARACKQYQVPGGKEGP